MIRIATDLHVSPGTAAKLAEAFAQMAACEEPIDGADEADSDEVKRAFGAIAEAIAEATPVSHTAAFSLTGDDLKVGVLREKAGGLFAGIDGKARGAGVAGRCVRAEVALLYVDDGGEGRRVGEVRQEFAPRPAILDPAHYPEDAALLPAEAP